MCFEIAKVHNVNPRKNAKNLQRVNSLLVSEGIYTLPLENCTYLESGKFLIWKFLLTSCYLPEKIKLNILVKRTRSANIREVIDYHTPNFK